MPSGLEPQNVPPPPPPKKYVPFSKRDSRAIEAAFQKLAEEEEVVEQQQIAQASSSQRGSGEQIPVPLNVTLKGKFKVPVNEDYLFDVDVENRELGPAYWLGPVYDVRRGTWFYSVSAGVSPCDENLATQLEEGYLKTRPWTFSPEEQARSRSSSQVRSRPTSLTPESGGKAALATPKAITPKASSEDLKVPSAASEQFSDSERPNKTFRLFGAHSNSMVTYQDANTAWLLTDDYLSRVNAAVYERFAGGGHYAGVKLVRGYAEPKKSDGKGSRDSTANSNRDSTINQAPEGHGLSRQNSLDTPEVAQEKRRMRLERQMSALVESAVPEGREKQEEEARRRNEQEMEDDYRDDDSSQQGREIEHLILVTHGIGQRLGLRIESVNFVHDVNTMRRTLKDVYIESPDLQALNGDVDKDLKNSRIQILPVCWRHLLDFPKQSLKHNRQEHDLGDTDVDDEEYPALEDINVEGVPAVRNLITDLALDILLYQSPAYKVHITRIVLEEANRVYNLFKERNPQFNGKISLVGHSLGSAIMFDILCKQPYPRSGSSRKRHNSRRHDTSLKLDFPVEDFYALGSPIGLFQMLKGRTIAARSHIETNTAETPDDEGDLAGDPFKRASSRASRSSSKVRDSLVDITTSSPAAHQIYNIFHPTDPIAYRLEPLVTNAMAPMKPQPLPYTKKGIFGTPVGQGLTGIGARVTQSVSGLWSSFSSGIANSLVNRSLGLNADQAAQMSNPLPHRQQGQTADPAAGGEPYDVDDPAILNEEKKKRLAQAQISQGENGKHPPTLIDAEMETLYAGFQRHLNGEQEEGDVLGAGRGQTVEEQARRLKREEQKVRALNANGRIDYALQEYVGVVIPVNSIANKHQGSLRHLTTS